jgi:pimeloyl-ACP methyl ester carboxylesterase
MAGRWIRSVRVLGLVGAAVAALLAPPGPANAHRPSVPQLSWGTCDAGVDPVYQCATAVLPMDYRHPRGRTVEVALIRLPASDPEHRIGSVFIGHPFGTFDLVAGSPPGALAGFTQFDVIGYDGRGAGRSGERIDCDTDRSLWQPFTTRETRPGVLDPATMVKAAGEYADRCVRAHGELLRHLSTATMARDLDLLRTAVGDQKLTYVGISQGTFIGSTYASMFPGRARAMVFDAPVDASTWRDRPLQAFRDQAAESEDVLGRFFTSCAAHQPACGFGGADPRAAYDRLVARLDRHPVPSPDPSDPYPVDGDDVRVATNEALYSPRFWAPLADALARAEAGDVSAIRTAARQGFGNGAINDPVSPDINLWLANIALDSGFPHKVRDYLYAGARNRRTYPHFGSGILSSGYDLMIPGRWPADSPDVYRGPFRNPSYAAPILVVGGTHDHATPYAWAVRLTKDLGNARLLTYESEGHGALTDGNPCVLISALTFLTDGRTLPAPGTVCTQTTQPFPG